MTGKSCATVGNATSGAHPRHRPQPQHWSGPARAGAAADRSAAAGGGLDDWDMQAPEITTACVALFGLFPGHDIASVAARTRSAGNARSKSAAIRQRVGHPWRINLWASYRRNVLRHTDVPLGPERTYPTVARISRLDRRHFGVNRHRREMMQCERERCLLGSAAAWPAGRVQPQSARRFEIELSGPHASSARRSFAARGGAWARGNTCAHRTSRGGRSRWSRGHEQDAA